MGHIINDLGIIAAVFGAVVFVVSGATLLMWQLTTDLTPREIAARPDLVTTPLQGMSAVTVDAAIGAITRPGV